MVITSLPQELEKITNPVALLDKSSLSSANVLVTTFNDVMWVE